MMRSPIEIREIRHFHLFCGLGGGAKGFNRGRASIGCLRARFRCLGGVDVSPAAIQDFERLSGVRGTVLDLMDCGQYSEFHGHQPPADWHEAAPEDIRRAAGGERPHIVFLSAPCKGFSGLLSESKSRSGRYQALNRLTVRGVWLMLEAWSDDPPELILFENVPRIVSRGRHLLNQIGELLRHYGYAVAETTHDCGELGGLAQSRKRFLLVARHREKVPPFLYQPNRRPLRAVGDILGRMPLPGAAIAGPMHRMPALQWKTWVRLAFVEAGSDWRSLSKLRVQDGVLADFGIMPEREWRSSPLGVLPWDQPCGTVTGRNSSTNGKFSVADPRVSGTRHNNVFRVAHFNETSPAVTGGGGPSAGGLAVADPRCALGHEYGQYGVLPWSEPMGAVSGQSAPGGGRYSVADPRPQGPIYGKYAVVPFNAPAGTVISGSTTGQGAYAVADPRMAWNREGKDSYVTQANFGVIRWDRPAGAVTGHGQHDNGPWSVADPRGGLFCGMDSPNSPLFVNPFEDTDDFPESSWAKLPSPADRLVAMIRALDGTWHRPFTTLELAALQGLIDPEERLELDGLSDQAWRERIGNAVPPPTAQAIAGVMGVTLLLAWSGESFSMSAAPVWVAPIAAALAVETMEVDR